MKKETDNAANKKFALSPLSHDMDFKEVFDLDNLELQGKVGFNEKLLFYIKK